MSKLSQEVKVKIVPILVECKTDCDKEKTVFYERRRIHLYICLDHAKKVKEQEVKR